MTLYPSGALVWNNTRQAHAGEDLRRALIDQLLEVDFAEFDPVYGGSKVKESPQAPVTVLCSIGVTAAGIGKRVYQDTIGERSQPFLSLAARLLDLAQDTAQTGVSADSLRDGLEKLMAGELAPEVLKISLLHLPADRDAVGRIVEIRDAMISSRAYRPGEQLDRPCDVPLGKNVLDQVAQTMLEADVATLPRTVAGDDFIRLQVSVLAHSGHVEARPRAATAEDRSESARLRLITKSLFTLP